MPTLSAQIAIKAAAAEVFGFVSKTANMPRYLPTLEKATRLVGNRLRLKGAGNGHRYELEGQIFLDEEALQISWAASAPRRCEGVLKVFETAAGAELACRIEFEPGQPSDLAGIAVPKLDLADEDVAAALEDILCAVKQAVECLPRPAPAKSGLALAGKDDYKLVI